MKTINRIQAQELINSTNGKIFSVTFMKKDGTIRDMTCRLGVTKHLKGGTLRFDPSERGLVTVFDLESKGYRMVNIETLISLNTKGRILKVRD